MVVQDSDPLSAHSEGTSLFQMFSPSFTDRSFLRFWFDARGPNPGPRCWTLYFGFVWKVANFQPNDCRQITVINRFHWFILAQFQSMVFLKFNCHLPISPSLRTVFSSQFWYYWVWMEHYLQPIQIPSRRYQKTTTTASVLPIKLLRLLGNPPMQFLCWRTGVSLYARHQLKRGLPKEESFRTDTCRQSHRTNSKLEQHFQDESSRRSDYCLLLLLRS